MSINIVLPPLRIWAQERLSAVLKATTQSAFDEAFDNFLSKHVNITVNGVHLSRDQYKKQLQGEEFFANPAGVKYDGVVEVPTDKTYPSGLVGLFYEATYDSKYVIHDTPVQSKVTSSLNLIIAQDKTLHPPTQPTGIHGDFDGRRVETLNQVFVDEPQTVHIEGAKA
ncbi:hypothetical protein PLICRDRAFT_108160 [Plicaturopsis crispa FD-325 SS-3]|nr:hypothetical protein PLICRDRAFT_108160 [Plicaturopsis crispa FD-325 SS-3]